MEYHPQNPPNDPAKLPDFLRQEFRRMAEVLAAPQKVARFVELHAEPGKVQNGDEVYADGTDWNPGSGRGKYLRKGTSWVFLG